MMNPQKKQKLIWWLTGALVGAGVTLVLECCCSPPPPSPPLAPVCADAAAPVALPATPEDASCPIDATPAPPPLAFDAGPSCGTHPWANAPTCCWDDCNS
jgi:hypothetical protein